MLSNKLKILSNYSVFDRLIKKEVFHMKIPVYIYVLIVLSIFIIKVAFNEDSIVLIFFIGLNTNLES